MAGELTKCVGQVTFRAKKALKGVTVTIVFHGVTATEGQVVNFISASRDIFSGGGSPPESSRHLPSHHDN